MNPSSSRLFGQLLAIEIATHVVAFLLTAVFAPRVLLLEEQAASASIWVILPMGALCIVLSVGLTVAAHFRVRPLLRALDMGTPPTEAKHVLALYGMPALLAIANVAFAVLSSLFTLISKLRPEAIDTYTQLGLNLLVLLLASTTTLPAYVLMRSQVARTLEQVPPKLAEEGLRKVGSAVLGRVRLRYVAAVALPVAFVALGASLLADAHARAYDNEARANDAIAVARAAFDSLGANKADDALGQQESIIAADSLGYLVQIEPDHDAVGLEPIRAGDEVSTQITLPLETGAARVRFRKARVSPAFYACALLAFAAVGLAGLLGTRAAAFFDGDLALATREIRRAGVAEVMRGTIMMNEARFSNVDELLGAIDALGGIFRQFAGAQRRAIDAREATERMRGLLLASMSHDLKAPLNAVLGFTELVRRNPLTKEQLESLAIIEQRGRELLTLIDTILDSARVEAGELTVSPTPTQLNDVVMSAVLEARDLSVGSDVQIMGEIQPGIPSLMVDGTRIAQALTAVVMTAARFSDKGIVPVRATMPADQDGDRVRIEVETSGEGLPVAEREKIFDAFKSAESARRQGGLGLGLQLARSIVEIHLGSIEVDNAGHGGVIFRIWLPLKGEESIIRARASRPTLATEAGVS
jgi:signal transduction histidine kinase